MPGGAPKGNKNAQKGAKWRDALDRALDRAVIDDDGSARRALDQIADRVVADAMMGDRFAWTEIANRLDGKPATRIDVGTDEDGKPLPARMILIGVDPDDDG